MPETEARIAWRRLDPPGRDACRLVRRADGWRLDGRARYRVGGIASRLAYRVDCDAAWVTRAGGVRGSIGGRAIDIRIARGPGGEWSIDGTPVPGLERCLDLDLGFTPATNLLPVRRCGLAVGRSVEAPAAWLDVDGATLALLPQRYERRSATAYWYEAPTAGYAALLDVAPDGFVRRYPGLWEVEG